MESPLNSVVIIKNILNFIKLDVAKYTKLSHISLAFEESLYFYGEKYIRNFTHVDICEKNNARLLQYSMENFGISADPRELLNVCYKKDSYQTAMYIYSRFDFSFGTKKSFIDICYLNSSAKCLKFLINETRYFNTKNEVIDYLTFWNTRFNREMSLIIIEYIFENFYFFSMDDFKYNTYIHRLFGLKMYDLVKILVEEKRFIIQVNNGQCMKQLISCIFVNFDLEDIRKIFATRDWNIRDQCFQEGIVSFFMIYGNVLNAKKEKIHYFIDNLEMQKNTFLAFCYSYLIPGYNFDAVIKLLSCDKFVKMLPDFKKQEILFESITSKVLSKVEYLCQIFDVNMIGNLGHTVLSYCCIDCSIPEKIFLAILSAKNIDPNITLFGEEETALSLAVKYGRLERVKLLLQMKNLDVNSVDVYGETPLFHACRNNSIEIIRVLLRHPNINLGLCNNKRETVFSIAKEKKFTRIYDLLK